MTDHRSDNGHTESIVIKGIGADQLLRNK